MLRIRIMGICLTLSMVTVSGRAESLAQAYRVAQKCSVLRKGGVSETRFPGFREDFHEMLGSAKEGLKESFSGRSFVYVGFGASLILAIYSQDKRIQAYFQENHPLRGVCRIGDVSGTILNSGFPAVGLYFLGRLSDNRELAEVGRVMFATTMLKWSLSLGLMYTVRRERPQAENLSVFEGGKASFPSGHVAGSFATATVLNEFYGPKVGIPAYLFASFVGLSRIEDNKHYASDVVGGAVLGTLTALAVSRATRSRWGRISATSVVEKRGAEVSLAYLL